MDKDPGSLLKQAAGISEKLNVLMGTFYEKTLMIKDLIENDKIGDTDALDRLVQERQAVIADYDVLKKEYDEIRQNSVFTECPDSFADLVTELQKTIDTRDKIIESISKVEANNVEQINLIYAEVKGIVNKIKGSKKMVQAYGDHHPSSDGVYFDRRK